jgi:Rrf2 family protein
MIFSKSTGYGIRALAYLARQPKEKVCSLSEIAEQEKIPPLFLQKILGELRRHRLLHSTKGFHGGYELGRPAEEITLREVFNVLEPDPYFDNCILGCGICSPETACGLHSEWSEMRKDLIRMLRLTTIRQIADAERGEVSTGMANSITECEDNAEQPANRRESNIEDQL